MQQLAIQVQPLLNAQKECSHPCIILKSIMTLIKCGYKGVTFKQVNTIIIKSLASYRTLTESTLWFKCPLIWNLLSAVKFCSSNGVILSFINSPGYAKTCKHLRNTVSQPMSFTYISQLAIAIQIQRYKC